MTPVDTAAHAATVLLVLAAPFTVAVAIDGLAAWWRRRPPVVRDLQRLMSTVARAPRHRAGGTPRPGGDAGHPTAVTVPPGSGHPSTRRGALPTTPPGGAGRDLPPPDLDGRPPRSRPALNTGRSR